MCWCMAIMIYDIYEMNMLKLNLSFIIVYVIRPLTDLLFGL